MARTFAANVRRLGSPGDVISPGETERIFLPFVRLDDARARDTAGAGLGLATARSLVLAHRGTITVDVGPACGSFFTIVLPLA